MQDRLARRSFIAALLALAATPARAAERPKVVATFSVLGDMIARIAGDKVQLTTIVGGDGDCELYQPTAADARAVAEARLFVMNDLNPRFEPWAEPLLKRAAFRGTKLVAIAGSERHHRRPASGAVKGPQVDQHAWHDPANGLVYVANIAEGLAQLDAAERCFLSDAGGRLRTRDPCARRLGEERARGDTEREAARHHLSRRLSSISPAPMTSR